MHIATEDITGCVLAGGRGSRMGGHDKGLQPLHGVPLALHALRRLAPQVGATVLSANRHLAAYERFGVPVRPDAIAGFAGPLAGFLAGLDACRTPWLVTVPCDAPDFPDDLVARLAHGLCTEDAQLAVARTPSADIRDALQPVFCLMRADLRDSLHRFLEGGGRKVGAWIAQHRCALVDFDDARSFFNANTLADLGHWESTDA